MNPPALSDGELAALRTLLDDPETGDDKRARALWALYRGGDPALALLQATSRVDAPQAGAGLDWQARHDYDAPPQLRSQTKPIYPRYAFDNKIQGTVVLAIVIGVSGRVSRVNVTQSIPALDQEAVRCAASWRFSPARKDGQPVASVADAPVSFRLY